MRETCDGDKIRVAVIDDHPVIREGIVELASQWGDVEIVGTGSNARDALAIVATTLPDVMLVDYRLGDDTCTAVCRTVKSKYPEVRVLCFTVYDDPQIVLEVLRAGAVGFVLKDSTSDQIYSSIRQAAKGNVPLDGRIVKAVVEEAKRHLEKDSAFTSLDSKEERLLAMVAAGMSNQEIAERLYVSVKTVKNMLTALYKKLGVENRTRAAALGVQMGLHRSLEEEIDEVV